MGRRAKLARMNYGRGLTSLFILAVACGDDGHPTLTMATAPTTAPTTNPTTNPATTNKPPGSDTDDSTSTTSATETDATSTAPTTGPTSMPGGPMFLSFSANVSSLTQDESVTFTAILTDPDGLTDIAGGSLRSGDESLEFGPFITAGQPGTYSISLTWAQIHQTETIEFDGGELPRTFRAVFFDQDGLKATQDITLPLVCAGGAACDGACTDLAIDGLNCGECRYTCRGGPEACEAGACTPGLSTCINYDQGLDTCTAACQSFGETCAENECGAGITVRFYNNLMYCEDDSYGSNAIMPCDAVQTWPPGATAIKCCCTDTK